MKKIICVFIICLMLFGCSSKTEEVNETITSEIAYKAVNKYCHENYDWSIAEENPDIMSISVESETEEDIKVTFHSYTDALVYFYVNKATGSTKMVEYVPALDDVKDLGTINIYDYIDK